MKKGEDDRKGNNLGRQRGEFGGGGGRVGGGMAVNLDQASPLSTSSELRGSEGPGRPRRGHFLPAEREPVP